MAYGASAKPPERLAGGGLLGTRQGTHRVHNRKGRKMPNRLIWDENFWSHERVAATVLLAALLPSSTLHMTHGQSIENTTRARPHAARSVGATSRNVSPLPNGIDHQVSAPLGWRASAEPCLSCPTGVADLGTNPDSILPPEDDAVPQEAADVRTGNPTFSRMGQAYLSPQAQSYQGQPAYWPPLTVPAPPWHQQQRAAAVTFENTPPVDPDSTASDNSDALPLAPPLSPPDDLPRTPLGPPLSTALPLSRQVPWWVPQGSSTGHAQHQRSSASTLISSPVSLGPPVPRTLANIQSCDEARRVPGAPPFPPGLGVQYYHRAMFGGFGESDIDGRRQIFIEYGRLLGESP